MNTSSARSRSLWPALASLIVLGSSAKVSAADPAVEVAPAAGGPASPAAPGTTQNGVGAIPAPPAMAPPSTAAPTTTTPIPVEAPPPPGTAGHAPGRRMGKAGRRARCHHGGPESSGCRRMPTRRLRRVGSRLGRCGSRSTACSGRTCPPLTGDQRFVVGVSGWGWLDTAYQKFGPWGMGAESALAQNRIRYLREQGRFCSGSPRPMPSAMGSSSRGRSSSSAPWIRRSPTRTWAARTPMISSCASASGIAGTSRWAASRVGRCFTSAWAWTRTRSSGQGAVGPGEAIYPISFYGLTDNQFRNAGGGQRRDPLVPAAVPPLRAAGHGGHISGQTHTRRARSAILDFGWVKLKGGVEYQHANGTAGRDQTDIKSKGVGGAIQFVFVPHVEFGLNAAQGTVESIDSSG